jgi:peptidoglycan/LPS O-acetylase OafA/YrhL
MRDENASINPYIRSVVIPSLAALWIYSHVYLWTFAGPIVSITFGVILAFFLGLYVSRRTRREQYREKRYKHALVALGFVGYFVVAYVLGYSLISALEKFVRD